MRFSTRLGSLVVFLLLLSASYTYSQQWPQDLIIAPERSNYDSTSSYAQVMAFINAIQQKSDYMHVETMAVSTEGKSIPLVVLANPKVTTPEEALRSGKPTVYIQGNIHGGEVEGKEAVMQIMRDILVGEKGYLLNNQILLFVPIYNVDGNDKMGENTRRSQEGSPVTAGSRPNGMGLDLNRDGVKMEAPETKGLVNNGLNKWDPILFVDLHTTNGTWHGYPLTYAPGYHTAGHGSTTDYVLNTLLPQVTETIDEKYDLKMYLYGGYNLRQGWPPKSYRTYNHHPRYLTNSMGLRNKMSILSETFAHDRFYTRIHSAYVFASEIIEHTNKHGRVMRAINKKAEQESIQAVLDGAGIVKKGVRFTMVPLETFTLRSYKYNSYTDDTGRTRYIRTGEIVEVPGVQNYNAFKASREATLPRGYLIPAEYKAVVDKLIEHGVKVEQLSGTKKAKGEEFTFSDYQTARRPFEGHNMGTLTGSFSPAERRFSKGTYKIDLAQPLANFIFYMLEPESDDGLVAWNFLDDFLKTRNTSSGSKTFPVFKYFEIDN